MRRFFVLKLSNGTGSARYKVERPQPGYLANHRQEETPSARKMAAIGDLFDLFKLDRNRDGDQLARDLQHKADVGPDGLNIRPPILWRVRRLGVRELICATGIGCHATGT